MENLDLLFSLQPSESSNFGLCLFLKNWVVAGDFTLTIQSISLSFSYSHAGPKSANVQWGKSAENLMLFIFVICNLSYPCWQSCSFFTAPQPVLSCLIFQERKSWDIVSSPWKKFHLLWIYPVLISTIIWYLQHYDFCKWFSFSTCECYCWCQSYIQKHIWVDISDAFLTGIY